MKHLKNFKKFINIHRNQDEHFQNEDGCMKIQIHEEENLICEGKNLIAIKIPLKFFSEMFNENCAPFDRRAWGS